MHVCIMHTFTIVGQITKVNALFSDHTLNTFIKLFINLRVSDEWLMILSRVNNINPILMYHNCSH